MAEFQCPYCKNVIKVGKVNLQSGCETDRIKWLDGVRLTEDLPPLESIEINRSARIRARVSRLSATMRSQDVPTLESIQINRPARTRADMRWLSAAIHSEDVPSLESSETNRPERTRARGIYPSFTAEFGIAVACGILAGLLVIGLASAWV